MEPISPVNAGPPAIAQPRQLQGASQVQASSSSAVATTTSSTTTAVSINQQTEAFLGSISPALADNAYLKLLIAAMIMQALLGDNNSKQQTGQGGLNLLESLSGSRQNAMYLSIESTTNTVQMGNQSSKLDVVGAVQSMSGSEQPDQQTGGQVDIRA